VLRYGGAARARTTAAMLIVAAFVLSALLLTALVNPGAR
jgi:hypothetical protein